MAAASDDLYVPVGIEEVEREGAPRAPRPKAGPTTSYGMADFDHPKNGARNTLAGLRNFEWAGLFLTLSNNLALPVAALVVVISAVNLGGALGAVSLAALTMGVAALGLFTMAVVFVILGAWASHLGRNELGVLQRKEVERAARYFWRGLYALVPAIAAGTVLAYQEATRYREALLPFATPLALVVTFAFAVVAFRYFSLFATQYLRNLTPASGKKGRRRLRAAAVMAGAIPFAIAVAGAPLVVLDYEAGCTYYGECHDNELWTLAAPSFGPPAHVAAHLPAYLPLEVALGSVVVAAVLLAGRLLAWGAIRGWRRQVREAEVFLRRKVRESTPPPAPPG